MENLVITNWGKSVIAEMISENNTLNFTYIAITDSDLTQTGNLEDIQSSDLAGKIKHLANVNEVKKLDTDLVEIQTVLDNSQLVNGYLIRGIALMARDAAGTEEVFAISVEASGDQAGYMPPFENKGITTINYKLKVRVGNTQQVTVIIDPETYAPMTKVIEIETQLDNHLPKSVVSEDGAHGIRYFDGVLEVLLETGEWMPISGSGGGGIKVGTVSNVRFEYRQHRSIPAHYEVDIFWEDPDDYIVDGELVAEWRRTILRADKNGYPASPTAGTHGTISKTRNGHVNTPHSIGFSEGETWYIRFFTETEQGAINTTTEGQQYETDAYPDYGIEINENEPDPALAVSVIPGTVSYTAGSADYDNFLFNFYPCTLNADGVETGKVNKNNFAEYENGYTVPAMTTGDNLMIAFPRRGIKIMRVDDKIQVYMTKGLNKPGFTYYAHTAQETGTVKDLLYIAAYKAYGYSDGKLHSWRQVTPSTGSTLASFESQAQSSGIGYHILGLHQLTYLQVMYLLKYRHLNAQAVIGRGFVDGNTGSIGTGGTDAKGMTYGESTGKQQMKLFGIEDFWGNVYEWVRAVRTGNDREYIITNPTNGAEETIGYYGLNDVNGYTTLAVGNVKGGFLPIAAGGSATTYYCDTGYRTKDSIFIFGGAWNKGSEAGAFFSVVSSNPDATGADVGARLMKL